MRHRNGDIFFFQAEDGIRDGHVTGVQTCALPILLRDADLRSVTAGHGAEGTRHCGRRPSGLLRSEERRVGKECRSRWSSEHVKKNEMISAKHSIVVRRTGRVSYAS